MKKKLKNPEHWTGGRCPDGTGTSCFDEYYHEWDDLRKQVEEITGLRVFALDPDLALCQVQSKVMISGTTVNLPAWFARDLVNKFNALKLKVEQAEQKNKYHFLEVWLEKSPLNKEVIEKWMDELCKRVMVESEGEHHLTTSNGHICSGNHGYAKSKSSK
jgi:hypothetical protein